MNAARLTRKWTDAGGDPSLMAEALADEINDPAAGLVSRDHLDMRVAELKGQMERRLAGLQGQMDRRFAELQGQMDRRFAESQAWLERRLGEHAMATTWRMLGMLGGQLVLIGALIKLLEPS
jgi:hypothetical protein